MQSSRLQFFGEFSSCNLSSLSETRSDLHCGGIWFVRGLGAITNSCWNGGVGAQGRNLRRISGVANRLACTS